MQVFFDPDIEGAKLKVKNELKLGWCGLGRKSSSKANFTLWAPTFSCCGVLCSSSLEKEAARR